MLFPLNDLSDQKGQIILVVVVVVVVVALQRGKSYTRVCTIFYHNSCPLNLKNDTEIGYHAPGANKVSPIGNTKAPCLSLFSYGWNESSVGNTLHHSEGPPQVSPRHFPTFSDIFQQ